MEGKQKENKNYDAWLIWNLCNQCTLACEYCPTHSPAKIKYFFPEVIRKIKKIAKLSIPEIIGIVTQRRKVKAGKISQIDVLTASALGRAGKVSDIDTSALINSLDKTNKIFSILFSGYGEPFLVPNIIEACVEITKKHYVSFSTNLISNKIKEFCEKIDPQKVVHIHASLHIKELERVGLLDMFIHNYLLCREKGFSMSAVAIAHPNLLDEADMYRDLFTKNGIEIKFDKFKGVYNGKGYPAAYTEQELEIFKPRDAAIPDSQKGIICNAGYNAAMVCTNGDVLLCADVHEKLGNIYTGFQFKDELIKCPADRCCCPLNIYGAIFLEKALKEKNY